MDAGLTAISKPEVLRYLGHRGQDIDARLDAQIDRCIQAVFSSARPRLAYRILEVRDGAITGLDLQGDDIKTLFRECMSNGHSHISEANKSKGFRFFNKFVIQFHFNYSPSYFKF